MNIYPIAFSVAAGDQVTNTIPVKGRIVGISTTFIGASAAANSADITFNVTIGGTSIMDGFISAAVWNQLVVPLWYPGNDKILDIDDIATVTAQNSSASTTIAFTITILTAE